jgi:glucose-like phosphotransferase system IIB component
VEQVQLEVVQLQGQQLLDQIQVMDLDLEVMDHMVLHQVLVLANNNYTEVASAVLAAVGGKENVKDVGYCATRLRFEVKDNAKVDEKAVKAAGAAGVIRPSKNACQVIIGTKVQFVYDELKKML